MATLSSESSIEVDDCKGKLDQNIAITISYLPELAQPGVPGSLESAVTDTDSSSIMTVTSVRQYIRSFESTLFATRPYRTMTNSSAFSLATDSSQHQGTRWSLFSGGSNTSVFSLPITASEFSGVSLADIPNIPSIPLAIQSEGLSNCSWYDAKVISWQIRENATTALLNASKIGDARAALRMIGLGANIDATGSDGRVALCRAVLNDHKSIIQLLLVQGANKQARDGDGNTPLRHAVLENKHSIIELLLDGGADIEENSKDGNTLLHLAVARGHRAIVRILLDRGADIEANDKVGNTPLHIAVHANQHVILELLLDGGADIEANGENGHTPLHLAIARGYHAIVGILLDRGADTEAMGMDGNSPLQLAVLKNQHVVIKLLLDGGADIEGKHTGKDTPLHLAVSRGYHAIVRILLDRGADIEAMGMDKNTCCNRQPTSNR